MASHDGMRVLTTQGQRIIEGLTHREASLVAHHWNAIRAFLERGDEDGLASFRGRTVGAHMYPPPSEMPLGGHVLEADPDVIEWHALRGEVSFESIYDEVI